jgi:hypothetical protein
MAREVRPDIRSGTHLPHLRQEGQAAEPDWLPRQRVGTTPQMVGRYPDFDVLASSGTWDEATRKTVFARLEVGGPLRFFSPAEEATLRALCDTLLAQDREPRVPVTELVDDKLAAGRLDGYQYEDMPDDRETWRLVLRGLDEEAQRFGVAEFGACDEPSRELIVGRFADGDLHGGSWDRLNVDRAWKVITRGALAAFYSHPWAWNEIGFGGPAYPRGYMRMGRLSVLEPFERPGATAEDPVRVTSGEEPRPGTAEESGR